MKPVAAFDSEDNWFVFKATPYVYTAAELDLATKMQAYWTAFATTSRMALIRHGGQLMNDPKRTTTSSKSILAPMA